MSNDGWKEKVCKIATEGMEASQSPELTPTQKHFVVRETLERMVKAIPPEYLHHMRRAWIKDTCFEGLWMLLFAALMVWNLCAGLSLLHEHNSLSWFSIISFALVGVTIQRMWYFYHRFRKQLHETRVVSYFIKLHD